MAERLQEFPDTKLERSQRVKNALGTAAIRTAAVVAMISATAAAAFLPGRHGDQETQAKAPSIGQQYVLVDNPYDDYNADTNSAEKSWCKWPSRWALCNKANDLASEALGTAIYVAEAKSTTVEQMRFVTVSGVVG